MSETGNQSGKWQWLGLILLALGVTALRWPTFDFAVWNVDEAIHAAVARALQSGGVLYRDAIDQRTPLTYYAVAALFKFSGANNVWAMHALATALIVGTMAGLFLLARQWHGPATGLAAALLYAVFSSALFYPGDAYALNTEWFVAGFATWAAWAFWRGADLTAGGLLGLAFLSKQPALLDLGAPILVLCYQAWSERTAWPRLWRRGARLLAGFAIPLVFTASYFFLKGAFADFHFYAWHYNLRYYAPEVGALDRVLTAFKPFQLLGAHYPLVLATLLPTLIFAGWRTVQLRPTPAEKSTNGIWLFVLGWSLTSLAGASASGRGFDHYYIQFLPACCLGVALGWGGLSAWAWNSPVQGRWLRAAAVLLTVLGLLQLANGTRHFRAQAHQPEDPSRRAGEFIKKHTTPEERIFVWGYHPDIYLFADRRPASRFVYASFLSGLIPWTNVAADKDTAYAIVPGARATLLRELEMMRPTFIVDCSVGPNRWWQKYPLSTFPELQAFITAHYALAEPDQFSGQGFALYLLKDSARRSPRALAGNTPPGAPAIPQLSCPADYGSQAFATFRLSGHSDSGGLQRLELLRDDAVIAGVSFAPTHTMTVSCPVALAELGAGEPRLALRATAAAGETTTSPAQTLGPVTSGFLPVAQLAGFPLPVVAAQLRPASLRAPYGATAPSSDGPRQFQIHAPAVLRYEVSGPALRASGRFGFQAGAHAASNTAPTDGAEFLVAYSPTAGPRQILFQRWLQPTREPRDQGSQFFSVALPPGAAGTLELIITNGPAGNAASDWTYWADLQLENSR